MIRPTWMPYRWRSISAARRAGSAGAVLQRRPVLRPGLSGLERRRRGQHGEVGAAAADDLQAHREAVAVNPQGTVAAGWPVMLNG